MNEIQHPTKSLLQDYWMSYMYEIQHPTKSLLQDYWMSYMYDYFFIIYLMNIKIYVKTINIIKNYKKNFKIVYLITIFKKVCSIVAKIFLKIYK